ncbi:MAG: hypothetical protein ACI9S8_002496 [Chlamydiales bacterium]|jgi:hypothetical protein
MEDQSDGKEKKPVKEDLEKEKKSANIPPPFDKLVEEILPYWGMIKEKSIWFSIECVPVGLEYVGYGFNFAGRYLRDSLKGADESLDEALEKGDSDELIQRLQTAQGSSRKEILRALLKIRDRNQNSEAAKERDSQKNGSEKEVSCTMDELEIDEEVSTLIKRAGQLNLGPIFLRRENFEDYYRLKRVMDDTIQIRKTLPFEPDICALLFFRRGYSSTIALKVFKEETPFHNKDIRRMISKVYYEERSSFDLGFGEIETSTDEEKESIEEVVRQILGKGAIFELLEEKDPLRGKNRHRVGVAVTRVINQFFPFDFNKAVIYKQALIERNLVFMAFLARHPNVMERIMRPEETLVSGNVEGLRSYLKGILEKIQKEKETQILAKELNSKVLPKSIRFSSKEDFIPLDERFLEILDLFPESSKKGLGGVTFELNENEVRAQAALEARKEQISRMDSFLDGDGNTPFKRVKEAICKKIKAIEDISEEFMEISRFMESRKEELYIVFEMEERSPEKAAEILTDIHKKLIEKRKTLERIRMELQKKYAKVGKVSVNDLKPLNAYLQRSDLKWSQGESFTISQMNNIFSDSLHIIEKASVDIMDFKNNLNTYSRTWYKADDLLGDERRILKEFLDDEERFEGVGINYDIAVSSEMPSEITRAYEESISTLESKLDDCRQSQVEELEASQEELRIMILKRYAQTFLRSRV